ncbi:MAG: hypothetical protein ACYC3I_18870, partial [Gemmataceae bacterium]
RRSSTRAARRSPRSGCRSCCALAEIPQGQLMQKQADFRQSPVVFAHAAVLRETLPNSHLRKFATDALAQRAINEVGVALALLDAIKGDAVRRAAAIASFPP